MPKLSPIAIIIILAAALAAGVFLYAIPRMTFTPLPSFSPLPTGTPQPQVSVPTSEDHTPAAGDVGIITQNGDGTSTYTSNKYKFRFSYSSEWDTEKKNIVFGGGTFGFFNFFNAPEGYDQGSTAFRVMMGITDDLSSFFSKTSTVIETKVAGQKAYRRVEDESGIAYAIMLSSQPGTYITIVMYGYSANPPVLDKLLKSLAWDS